MVLHMTDEEKRKQAEERLKRLEFAQQQKKKDHQQTIQMIQGSPVVDSQSTSQQPKEETVDKQGG